MIDWVFFDVGNVLFNDDPQSFAAYRHYHAALCGCRPGYTFDEMLREREELAGNGATWVLHKLAARAMPQDRVDEIFYELRQWLIERYDDVHIPQEGLEELLGRLRERYRLGVIANQTPECRASLRRRGLLEYFDVVAISEELDLHKPDPKLFQWAIEQSGADPARSVMVGDRLDNDVAPARSVGMKTIWLRWPDSARKNWLPDDPLAREFLLSCDRVPVFHSLADPVNIPDRQIGSLHEVLDAVQSLANGETD